MSVYWRGFMIPCQTQSMPIHCVWHGIILENAEMIYLQWGRSGFKSDRMI